MALTVNTREFEKALKQMLEHTSRDVPTVLNRTARDVVIKAAELTPKADKMRIEKSLTGDTITTTSTGKLLKKPKLRPSKRVYMILNAKQRAMGKPGLNNNAMSSAARKFVTMRKSAAGYTGWAGWQKALLALGGRGFGNAKQPGFEKSLAARGSGSAATVGNLLARMINAAPMSEKLGTGPLQAALNSKTNEMLTHLEEKLADRCRAASH